MEGANVAVLIGRSLFADGVVTHLRQSPQRLSLAVVNLCEADPLRQIVELNPSVIIFDELDPELQQKLSLEALLKAFSSLIVICLHSQTACTRVIRWEETPLPHINDMLTLIREYHAVADGAGRRKLAEPSTV